MCTTHAFASAIVAAVFSQMYVLFSAFVWGGNFPGGRLIFHEECAAGKVQDACPDPYTRLQVSVSV